MNAKTLREQDMAQRGQVDALTRQTYYYQLRDAIYDELMQQGFCELLEELLLDWRTEDSPRIYVLDYAAMMECHSMIVGGKKPRDATEFVPHLNLRGGKSCLGRAGSAGLLSHAGAPGYAGEAAPSAFRQPSAGGRSGRYRHPPGG